MFAVLLALTLATSHRSIEYERPHPLIQGMGNQVACTWSEAWWEAEFDSKGQLIQASEIRRHAIYIFYTISLKEYEADVLKAFDDCDKKGDKKSK